MESNDGEDESLKKRQHLHRVLLVGVTVLYIVFYAGAFFGWGPMQLMLEENGHFEDRCTEEEQPEDGPCPAQTTWLLNVQLVAMISLIFSPVLGALSDTCGTFSLMCLTAFCACTGLAFLTIAASQNLDGMLFATFILLGIMAVSSSVMIVQTGMIFHGVIRQRIISVLNTLFDAGALTYLALWGIQEATGAALEMIAGGYFIVAVLCFGVAVWLWRTVVPVRQQSAPNEDQRDNMAHQMESDLLEESSPDHGSFAEIIPEKDETDLSREISDVTTEEAKPEIVEAAEEPIEDPRSKRPSVSTDYVIIAERHSMEQLKSKQFVTLVLFFAVQGASNIFTLTTARDFLAYLGDDETGNKYLTIFTLLTPASILGLPFMDWILIHRGFHAGFQSINFLALVHGIIKVSSDNLNVQVIGFVVFSFFRCFLFTISFSFLPTFLGTKVVGKSAGILSCIQGLFSFINIPLASLAVNQLDGNFFVPNLFYTLATLPCIYAAWIIGEGIKKEEQAKKAAL